MISCTCRLNAVAQRNCGQVLMLQHLEEQHPGSMKQIAAERKNVLEKALSNTNKTPSIATTKTTNSILIPVVFHFVIDSNAFNSIGGIAGIENRINSQLTVINNDFNAQNADQSKIPTVWKPLFANVGIQFGLATTSPTGNASVGYDLRIVPNGTRYDITNGAKAAKFSASGGIDAWDNTRYLNIWVANLYVASSTALGVTTPPTFPGYSLPELGVTINYLAFGSRTSASQPFIRNIDRGRTLTHELGHYFFLIHTWGDDGGLCPGTGGIDDGIAETPPETDAIFNAPSFPKFDACSPSGNGVMFMNYMDYTDDTAMFLFTNQQAAVMQAELAVGGHSNSLALHPYLADTNFKTIKDVKIYPNPTSDYINIEYNSLQYKLLKVDVVDMQGKRIIQKEEPNISQLDIRGLPSAIYIINCYFEHKVYTQKIRVQ